MSDEIKESCAEAFLPAYDWCLMDLSNPPVVDAHDNIITVGAGRIEGTLPGAIALAEQCRGWQVDEGRVALVEEATPDPRWFCQEGRGVSSFYDKCDACVSAPLCCCYALARSSTSRSHR